MQKTLLLSILCAVSFCGCTFIQHTATDAPQTAAQIAPSATAAKKTAPFQFPKLENQNSWSMVIVPDIQTYIKQIENHGILDMMLAWIVRRREEMNIQQVLFTGDLVYSNDALRVNQPKGVRYLKHGGLRDLVSEEQWKAMSRLMERLDGEVPYILCTGNHDYGYYSAENRNSFFNKYNVSCLFSNDTCSIQAVFKRLRIYGKTCSVVGYNKFFIIYKFTL